MPVKSLRPRKLIASAILAGAAASAITANAGQALAAPDGNPPVVGEAKSQAHQPGSGGSTAQPGLPGQSQTPATNDSAQPGLPSTGSKATPGTGDAGPPSDSSTSGPSAQPGLPTSPKAPPQTAPAAPAPRQDQPGATGGGSAGPATPAPTQPGTTGDGSASPAAPIPKSVPVAPASTDPAVVPKPAPPTFEQKLQHTQPVDFPQVTEPATGTSQPVQQQQYWLSGKPQYGPYVIVPAHQAPVVKQHSTPLVEHGHQVGSINNTTVGPYVSSSTSSRVQPDQIVSAGVIKVPGNRIGVAQQAHKTGAVQAAAATTGTQAGYGSGYVSNTPHPAGGGSTAAAHGQWQLPAQGIVVKASGKTDFKSMQVPKVSGVVNIKTPWGNFNTPPIK